MAAVFDDFAAAATGFVSDVAEPAPVAPFAACIPASAVGGRADGVDFAAGVDFAGADVDLDADADLAIGVAIKPRDGVAADALPFSNLTPATP